MKALIIAAGNGTRMQPVTRGRHKSLMPLLGLKIIERVILGAKEAGISEFVIVTGYRGKDLRKTIGDGQKYGVTVSFVNNDNWKKANGISVFKAGKYFNDNFVLLMSDHVFDPGTLIRIQRLKLKDKECVLAVDRNLDSVLDVSDTTKVMARGGKIMSIGKNLEAYNSYDTGMFVCSSYLFKVLAKTTSMGKNSLTNGMSVLVKEGRLRTFDIKNRFWADCDTYEDIKFARRKLLLSLAKPSDGVISKNFNRKISTFITKFLINTPVTPNMVSFAIPFLAIITFFLLVQGKYPWIVFGGLLIQLMSILDGCDGEIARLKFLKSKWGGFFDATIDKYIDTAAVTGMALGYLRITGNELIVPIALFVIFALGLDGYMPNKFEVYVGKRLNFNASQFINFKRDIRLLILAVGAILNQILIAFLIILFVYHLKVIIRLVSGKKTCEEIEARNYSSRLVNLPLRSKDLVNSKVDIHPVQPQTIQSISS